mgnify:CR=1 FL=1
MTKIPLGKVAFTDAGSYNAGKTYKRFDFVDTEDSSYLSLQDNNKGYAVTETAWWKCLARGTAPCEPPRGKKSHRSRKKSQRCGCIGKRKSCGGRYGGWACECRNNASQYRCHKRSTTSVSRRRSGGRSKGKGGLNERRG